MSALIQTGEHAFVREILGRSDFAIIGGLVEPNTKVLDLGCGDGELLEWLAENKKVDGRGIEISSARVQRAIRRGVSAYQCDIDQGLADYPDQAFDYVILSQTLQETRHPLGVLKEMLRVGRHAIVTFPNFGHWSVRLAHLVQRARAQDQAFPSQLVRLPQHPLPDGEGLRGTGAAAGLDRRAQDLPFRPPSRQVPCQPHGGGRRVPGAAVEPAAAVTRWPAGNALGFSRPV